MSDSLTETSPVFHKSPVPKNDLERKACSLCGLPVGRSGTKETLNGEILHFCCQGCLHVFKILFNSAEGIPSQFRESELYRACVEWGIIPRNEQDLALKHSQGDDHETKEPSASYVGDPAHAQEATLKIEGMWCSACAWLIEEVLKNTKGVSEARVFFLSDMARVTYLPQSISPKEILTRIAKLGYGASLFQDPEGGLKGKKDLLIRLGVSSFLTANIMMISFALYLGFFQEFSRETIGYLSYPLAVLAAAVVFYGGYPILMRAFAGFRHGSTSMDTLISLGASSAYAYSLFQMAAGSLHVYFDTASMLVTLVLLGKYIEGQAKERISRGIRDLYHLSNRKVRLLLKDKERWVSPDAVAPGQEVLVLAGETVPIDGRVISNEVTVDESLMTGESRPAKKRAGDEVIGGTVVLEGPAYLRATRAGQENSLKQMIGLMEEALSKKNPFEVLADRVMRWFVPTIFLLALGTVTYLLFHGASIDAALLRGVTVLIITCPCALGIASPLAKVAAIGVCRSKGILVRGPEALEKAKDLDVMVLDKTGTMTEGNFSLRHIESPLGNEEDALRQIASVEIHSDHFLAREIVRRATQSSLEIEKASEFKVIEGKGITGNFKGRSIVVGNRELIRELLLNLSPDLEEKASRQESRGMTVVFFGWEGRVQGILGFGDSLKEGAREAVEELRKRGVTVYLVSGDAVETTQAVAEQLGIDHVRGRALPRDKVEMIKTLQGSGHRVGMVGDGFNDAAALARADVGVALGTGVNIAQEASEITLMTGDPRRILDFLDLSAFTVKVVRQNLVFAFLYNAIGIPLAVAGLLNPLIAVFAMFASSLSVIGNSLRITRRGAEVGLRSSEGAPIKRHPLKGFSLRQSLKRRNL